MISLGELVTEKDFKNILAEYQKSFDYGLALVDLVDNRGLLYECCGYYNWQKVGMDQYQRMITESVRWGEPNISMDSFEIYLWSVPVCFNNEVIGGFFSASHGPREERNREKNVREASWRLLEIVEEMNLCPRSLMQLNRMASQVNARMAEAIHSAKGIYYQNPRDIYMIEERNLINAIRDGDISRAREIINRVLVGIYHFGKHDFDILKALVLEMVVQMYRAVVEEGADPKELLGVNSSYLADFIKIKDEVELSSWLTAWLETFIKTTIDTSRQFVPSSLSVAIEYMKSNISKPISRDEVARVCNVSPSYFSRLLRLKTGYTFTDLLNKLRVDTAISLLETTDMNVSEVAFAVGFNDQSYFTRIFHRLVGVTPKNYRKKYPRSLLGRGGKY